MIGEHFYVPGSDLVFADLAVMGMCWEWISGEEYLIYESPFPWTKSTQCMEVRYI